jgi:predicted AAA+ superfamily ATPase
MFLDALIEFKFPLLKAKLDSAKNEIFPENGIGSALFCREALIARFLKEFFNSNGLNFYIRGPRGSGKTMVLYLIGQELQRQGETVYFVKHADAF